MNLQNFAMQAIDHLQSIPPAKTLYMSGGQMGCPIVFRGPTAQPPALFGAAQPGLMPHVIGHIPAPQGRPRPMTRRMPRPAQGRDPPTPNPVVFPRAMNSSRHQLPVPDLDDYVPADRQAAVKRAGTTSPHRPAYSAMVGFALQAAAKSSRSRGSVLKWSTCAPSALLRHGHGHRKR